jgi:glutamate racemase
MNNGPIGIFDSGVGGLTILSELVKKFPNESFIYIGDSARAPYGDKSEEDLYKINQEIIQFLLNKNIKALVMACNTSCSLFLDKLQSQLNIPVIGLIRPAIIKATQISKNKRIAVLATAMTVKQHTYRNELIEIDPSFEISEIECPKLVPIIEKGKIYTSSGFETASKYFKKVQTFDADTVIYGCSHYPFLEPVFTKLTSKFIHYVDPGKTNIQDIYNALTSNKIEAEDDNISSINYFVSGDIQQFTNFFQKYCPQHLTQKNHKINKYLI